jgi:predicted DNA-binding transcriptional regulator AlpA
MAMNQRQRDRLFLDQHLDMKTVRERLGGVSERSVERWVAEGKLPPPLRLGRKRVWSEVAVAEALEKLRDEQAAG